MDDSGRAGATTIGAILGKGVFKGTSTRNQKSGVGFSPMVSVDELASVTSTKSEAEGLEAADEIEDSSVSGSG